MTNILIFIYFIKNNSLCIRETFTIFTGGLSMEKGGKSPCITVLQGKATTVLEMEHPVVDFITICETPWPSGMNNLIFYKNTHTIPFFTYIWLIMKRILFSSLFLFFMK